MGRRILDVGIVGKIAAKRKCDHRAVGVLVSQKAAKLGISSEAALVILAKQYDIGTAVFQRKLDPAKQAEVRHALSTNLEGRGRAQLAGTRKAASTGRISTRNERTAIRTVVDYVIEDKALRARCRDVLLASKNFDRAINQATLVLEDRIRRKAQLEKKLTGEPLVGAVFNPELSKTVLTVASGDTDDQRGFAQILRGIVPAFRNITHHHVVDTFSREDAMRICGFIDLLLRVVENSSRTPEGVR